MAIEQLDRVAALEHIARGKIARAIVIEVEGLTYQISEHERRAGEIVRTILDAKLHLGLADDSEFVQEQRDRLHCERTGIHMRRIELAAELDVARAAAYYGQCFN